MIREKLVYKNILEVDWVIKVKIRSDFEVNLFGSGVSEFKFNWEEKGGEIWPLNPPDMVAA